MRLLATLEQAVPRWIEQRRDWPAERRRQRAVELRQLLAEKSDVLQHGGGSRHDAARVFHLLAESLALAAFEPGGVRFDSLHFEVT